LDVDTHRSGDRYRPALPAITDFLGKARKALRAFLDCISGFQSNLILRLCSASAGNNPATGKFVSAI
jgi:hypothetical protein